MTTNLRREWKGHDSAFTHVTGESIYIDDRPEMPGEVFVDFVGSPVAHGRIRAIDLSAASLLPGAIAFFTATDLHCNLFGGIIKDQPLLAHDVVNYVTEPIVVVVAASRAQLKKIKRAVRIEVEELEPILTIEAACKANSWIGVPRKIARGDTARAIAAAPYTLSRVFRCKGQEHFYFETQSALAYPGENDTIEVLSSSQHPTEIQHDIAETLGIPMQNVVVTVKRLGGGFGGKESQSTPYAQMAALAAHKLRRPARIVLERDDDMASTGKRHPFENHYTIAFDDTGRILAYEVSIFSDGGAYADLSTAILERAMLHSENAYYLENVKIEARACRTHFPPNTAFRGFGAPQGVATIEDAILEVAAALKRDPHEIRLINCYGEAPRNTTPYAQVLDNNLLPQILTQLSSESSYVERRMAIAQFNRTSETLLKGIALTPVKFGISFTSSFLNQGSALVNLHRDGTVQVSTGAIEMGQGVNTKIAQVVAGVFGIEASQVRVMSTSTEKNHNTSPTAASSGADINCGAAILASERIRERLAHVALAFWNGECGEIDLCQARATADVCFQDGLVTRRSVNVAPLSLVDLLTKAYLNRVSMGEQAYYKTPGIHFDREKGIGNPFKYFTQGACVSEVSIDRFTGEVVVTRADILMDLGKILNEAIDRGQISGAFIQGMGWVTTEEMVHDRKGRLLSSSTSTYKIPSVQDLPPSFSIKFIKNDLCNAGPCNSKAVGEPPFVLGISVWAAIKHAISSVTLENTRRLGLPATCEEILLTLKQVAGEERL